jgi:hypothetical protein
LGRWCDGSDVVVETFVADVIDGVPARQLYTRFGFGLIEILPTGPEGAAVSFGHGPAGLTLRSAPQAVAGHIDLALVWKKTRR